MGHHQFRLPNWNEDGSPTRDRDDRPLRYLLASNSSSSFAFNNRTGSNGTNYQDVPHNIMQNNALQPTHIPHYSITTNTTTSNTTNDNRRPSPPRLFGSSLYPTTININNYNDNQTSISSDSSPPRLFGSSLYPSIMTGGTTQGATSTSLFQINNNLFSSEAGSSPSFQNSSWGFNGFYNNDNNNLDLFDSIQQRSDDTFVQQTVNMQEYVRLLPGGRVSIFLAPSIVPVQSNSYVPQQPQPPSDPSTSSYRLNHLLPPPRRSFLTADESNQYIHTSISLARSGNRRLRNNHILTSTSPEFRAHRNRLRDQVFSSLQYLRNGGSIRTEDMQIIDYSIVLDLIDSQERFDMLHHVDDWPYEMILDIEDHIRRLEIGLTEEEILTYIETKFYVSNPNETSTQNEICTICQDDYVEGEIIGRLDCRHIYHLECIKQWLLLKNVCPICKQIALKVGE